MKNLALGLPIVVLLAAGCTTSSNNTRSHNKLLEVNVDGRDTTSVEISTCPKALAVGVGSCNVEVQ